MRLVVPGREKDFYTSSTTHSAIYQYNAPIAPGTEQYNDTNLDSMEVSFPFSSGKIEGCPRFSFSRKKLYEKVEKASNAIMEELESSYTTTISGNELKEKNIIQGLDGKKGLSHFKLSIDYRGVTAIAPPTFRYVPLAPSISQ